MDRSIFNQKRGLRSSFVLARSSAKESCNKYPGSEVILTGIGLKAASKRGDTDKSGKTGISVRRS